MSETGKNADQGHFMPRSPPKPGFSIRAFVARKPHKEDCIICLESSFHWDFKSLGCNHRFHAHCLATMLNKGNRTCPLCRANINDSWLEAEEMKDFFIPRLSVDDVFDDMWIVYDDYDADDDDDSEYYTSDDDDNIIFLADHRRIDFFELDGLGLEQLFQNYDDGEDDCEYFGTEQNTSDDDDYIILIADHRRIDFFELDELGLERLFQI